MQDPNRSSDQLSHFIHNGHSASGNNNARFYSNTALSDSASWDSDFDDDEHSESSGVYGDVGFSSAEKAKSEVVGSMKSGVQGKVAALAKSVAASLSAAGSTGVGSARNLQKLPPSNSRHTSSCSIGSSAPSPLTGPARPTERPPLKPSVKTPTKPPIPSRPSVLSHISPKPSPPAVTKQSTDLSCRSSTVSNSSSSSSGVSSSSSLSLPKPPAPASEQVRQVIGALGQLWPSDSVSLSSQTQSDDDYEPVLANSSTSSTSLDGNTHHIQKTHLHGSPFHRHSGQGEDASSTLSLSHSVGQKGPHPLRDVNSKLSKDHPPHSKRSSHSQSSPPVPFLHSPAAAAALAAAAVSARSTRLTQYAAHPSVADDVTTPSSQSSLDRSSNSWETQGTVRQNQHQDRVYEPVEESEQVPSPRQSYLHPSDYIEKTCDGKRVASASNVAPSDQRPPVPSRPLRPADRPNRPLPPTPRPSGESVRSSSITSGLEYQPWFHNVDRKRAEELIRNGVDGYFLIRPSSQSQNPLTLTLWYNQRVYNISVRQRRDGRIALGFEKPDEQSFSTIEEMVSNYQSENLLLFSRNERTGRTVLTSSPPKQ